MLLAKPVPVHRHTAVLTSTANTLTPELQLLQQLQEIQGHAGEQKTLRNWVILWSLYSRSAWPGWHIASPVRAGEVLPEREAISSEIALLS